MPAQAFKISKSETKAVSIGTWNVRGLRKKVKDIEEVQVRKNVDICAIQETKTDALEETPIHYEAICFHRDQKQYGQAFLILFLIEKNVKYCGSIVVGREKTLTGKIPAEAAQRFRRLNLLI